MLAIGRTSDHDSRFELYNACAWDQVCGNTPCLVPKHHGSSNNNTGSGHGPLCTPNLHLPSLSRSLGLCSHWRLVRQLWSHMRTGSLEPFSGRVPLTAVGIPGLLGEGRDYTYPKEQPFFCTYFFQSDLLHISKHLACEHKEG